MIRRPLLAAVLVPAALLSLCAVTPSFAQRRRPRANVTLTRPVLTPKTVKGGANITARVTITATGGATVNSVSLRLDRAGATSSFVSMSAAGRVWTATFSAPANFSGRAFNMSVVAIAQTSVGQKAVKLGVVKVNSTPLDPNSPPPPPPI